MARRVWTAEELEQLTPAEQDEIFASSVITNLEEVPPAFLEHVRARAQEHIANAKH